MIVLAQKTHLRTDYTHERLLANSTNNTLGRFVDLELAFRTALALVLVAFAFLGGFGSLFLW